MPSRGDFLEGLLELSTLREGAIRRAAFRHSIASLALAASVDGPGPLEGLNPQALLKSNDAQLVRALEVLNAVAAK